METKLKDLKGLLDLTKLAPEAVVEDRFKELADKLFNNFYISKGADRYDFLEIEFYYYCDKHKDLNISSDKDLQNSKTVVYPRTTNAGDLFVHYSGIDIAFESNESNYGGILIRALLKTDHEQNVKEVIAGPLRCSLELLNKKGNFFNNQESDKVHIELKLEENKNAGEVLNIERTIRQGIANDAEYCYYVRERGGCNTSWSRQIGGSSLTYAAIPWDRINKKAMAEAKAIAQKK